MINRTNRKMTLENRIARLESSLNSKRKMNERNNELARALDFIGRAVKKAYNILDGNLASDVGDVTMWSGNDAVMRAYDDALTALEDLSDTVASAMADNDSML